ncbi:hypothetical protein IAT38_003053 [Cryptococcus sp. DSM 104549]
MSAVIIYLNDHRYPGPAVHPVPPFIAGIPKQEEIDFYPKLVIWGELKRAIMAGELDRSSRNKHLMYKFRQWKRGIEAEYGSSVNYLHTARLPFLKPSPNQKISDLTPSAGFANFTVKPPADDEKCKPEPEYLNLGPNGEFDETKYAVLLNDWPYMCLMVCATSVCGRRSPLSIPSSSIATLAGNDMRGWAGVQYEMCGGHEVGKMVKRLWDERGWECLWFLNPPRIQTVQGFSHFHVLCSP